MIREEEQRFAVIDASQKVKLEGYQIEQEKMRQERDYLKEKLN